jgi:hypothetical protein
LSVRSPIAARLRLVAAATATALALGPGVALGTGVAPAGAPEDRILPLDQYTSAKARRLAENHLGALRELNVGIYHCIPWVEVARHSIGFFRPKHKSQDDRYLSIRVYIEQDPSPQFAALRVEDRASAMFSRYVGHLLQRMAHSPSVLADPAIDGFTVVLEWMKQAPRAGSRPVHETIAVFVPRSLASEYLKGRVPIGQVADSARVLGWDGETALGTLRLTAWDDNFVLTHKVSNYQLDPGVTCG